MWLTDAGTKFSPDPDKEALLIKLDIINEVVNRTGITKTKAEMAVETVFESMKKALEQGDRIELRGFGVFNVKPRKTGIGRNPRTGAEVSIPPGKAVRFKPGKELQTLQYSRGGGPTVSSQDYSPAPYPFYSENGASEVYPLPEVRQRERYWLYGLLFLLTLTTTTVTGAAMQAAFDRNIPFDLESSFPLYGEMWRCRA